MAKFLRIPFLVFTEYLPPTASEIPTVSFLRIFFVSLNKSALLHHRCLMSKFTEMLMLVCKKIFSAFNPTLLEGFSNGYGFVLLQEFNIFCLHLVLFDIKHFCSVLTDLSNLLFLFHKIKQRMWRMFLPNSFQKCRSSCLQMFFRSSHPEMFCKKAVLRDFPKFTRKHLCQSLFITKVAGQGQQLYLKRDPVSWCFLWILQNLEEHLFLQNTSGGCF